MGSITITGLADDLVARLSQLPADQRQMIEREVRTILQRAVPIADLRRDRARRAAAIAAMTPKDVVQTDSVELLREDRDR